VLLLLDAALLHGVTSDPRSMQCRNGVPFLELRSTGSENRPRLPHVLGGKLHRNHVGWLFVKGK
jgi:hypothetical protein